MKPSLSSHTSALCFGQLQLTAATTTLPLLIGAVEARFKKQLWSLHLFCRDLVCASGRETMTRLKAAYGASFSAAKQTAWLVQTLCVMPGGAK